MDPPVSEPACVVVADDTTDSDSILGIPEFPFLSPDISCRLPTEQPSSSGVNLDEPNSPYSRVAQEFRWVFGKIRSIESYYNTVQRMDEFLRDHAITRDPEDDLKVIAVHASQRSRVCYPAILNCDLPSFFVYDTFFLRLKLSVPFNDFECAVLSYLRVAPTQLHPVSWGYVKAFQVLMAGLGLEPLAGVFFSFFQVKGSYNGKWVSLNVVPRRRLLKPIESSYKRWKPYYFRISCLDKHKDIFLSDGKPKHPLAWVEHPRQFLQYDASSMTDAELKIVHFLSEQCTFHKEGEAPHCLDLINSAGHHDRLLSYLGKYLFFLCSFNISWHCANKFFFCSTGTRYPNMDRERLRKLRETVNIPKGPEAGGNITTSSPATSVPVAPTVSRADSEETHDSQALKRPRIDKGVTVAVSSAVVPQASLSALPGLEHLKISNPGKLAGVLYAIGHANRLAAEYAGSIEGEHKSYRDKIKDLQQKNSEASKIIGRERAALLKKDETISAKNNEILRLTQENESFKKRIQDLESEVAGAKSELVKCKEEIDTLERGALLNYENGYAEALKHLKHQHPDEDLSVYGVFNEIIDGRLVDPSTLKDAEKASGSGPTSGTDPPKTS